MTARDPESRVDATRAQEVWKNLRCRISMLSRLWRLKSRKEIWPASVLKDGLALIGQGARVTMGFFSWISDIQG